MSKINKLILPGGIPSPYPPKTLSVCMIVKNEEKTLPGCLECANQVADEIILVDTGSTDRTLLIAKAAGAKVIESDWRNDFSYSRNISLDHATSSWILWLDADDRLNDNAIRNILRIKTEINNLSTAFGFLLRNATGNGRTGNSCMQIRMFPNDKRVRFIKRVHEQVSYALDKCGYRIQYLKDVEVTHLGYDLDEEALKKKALRNRAILEEDMLNFPEDPHYLSAYGDTFFMAQEWEKGIEAYKKVFALAGCAKNQRDIYTFMPVTIALGYKHLRQFQDALSWVEKGLAIEPAKFELLFMGGEIAYEAGDDDAALHYYEQAARAPEILSTTPIDFVSLSAKAKIRVGDLLKKKGEWARAKAAYSEAPGDVYFDIPASLGEIFLEEGKLPDALHKFNESITRFPGADVRAYRGLATICLQAGKTDDAISFLNKGLSFFPADPSMLEALKNLYRAQGDMARYLEISRRMIST